MSNLGISRDRRQPIRSPPEPAVIILTHGVFVTRIIILIGRNLKTFLFKIYNYFSINIYMADFSVQFYLYRNQNIRGIILDKKYHYHTVLVEAYN